MGGTISDDKVFTVTQITGLIKTLLEDSFPQICIKGEISNYRPSTSGHVYFVLKDTESQLSAVMFRFRASTLDFAPKDGMLVQVQGSISVYPGQGRYQIIVNKMTKAGTGDIMEMIEERKRRLAQEGLFDARRKRPLPFFPKTIGVVTSPTGAALRDILRVSRERNPGISITVLPAVVQGSGAAQEIVRMIQAANAWSLCDVLIVGRGGGSLEDLLPFSEESVVRAIASSRIPVISAVGHDIDWALSDFAADVRAATPSNAAEIAVPEISYIETSISQYKEQIEISLKRRIESLRLMLKTFSPDGMEMKFRQIEQPLTIRFEAAKEALSENIKDLIKDTRDRIAASEQTLENCNPQSILDRGYSMVTDQTTGKVIRSPEDTISGSTIIIRPAKGIIKATVAESEK